MYRQCCIYVRNGANSIRACSGMQRCCCKRGSVFVFLVQGYLSAATNTDKSQQDRCSAVVFLSKSWEHSIPLQLDGCGREGQLCINSFVRLFVHSFLGGYAAS